MMKKLLSLALAPALLIPLCGCPGKSGTGSGSGPATVAKVTFGSSNCPADRIVLKNIKLSVGFTSATVIFNVHVEAFCTVSDEKGTHDVPLPGLTVKVVVAGKTFEFGPTDDTGTAERATTLPGSTEADADKYKGTTVDVQVKGSDDQWHTQPPPAKIE